MSDATDAERLALCAQPLTDWYWSIKPIFAQEFPGSSLTIAQGFRTPEMQQAAHLSGRSKANGSTRFSKHQLWPSQAIDVMVVENGTLVDDGADRRYAWLANEARRSDIFPGVDFKSAEPDFDHFEVLGPQPTAEQVSASLAQYQQGGSNASSTA